MHSRKGRWWKRIPLVAGLLAALGIFSAAQEKQPTKSPASAEADPAGEMVKTRSGLRYQDLKIGDGAEAVKGKKVAVHYTGWLANGRKFDSSLDRKKPFEFRVGRGEVIQGWDEGVVGMKVGGKRRLIIPHRLAYGERGAGEGLIPPYATLTFEIELLDVK